MQKQVRLSLTKSARLCMSGIAHRLLRSTLTQAVILLAVAFFMVLLSENSFLQSINKGVRGEIRDQRETARLIGFYFTPMNSLVLSDYLDSIAASDERIAEFVAVSAVEEKEILELAKLSVREQAYLDFFRKLSIGLRRSMVQRNDNRDIFRYLMQAENWENFVQELRLKKGLELPFGGTEEFKSFLNQYPDYLKRMNRLEREWSKKIEAFSQKTDEFTGGVRFQDWLVSATPEQKEAWRKELESRGFVLPAEKFEGFVEDVRVSNLRAEIARILNSSEKKNAWFQTFLEKTPLNEKLTQLDDARVVELLDNKYTTEDLAAVSRLSRYEAHLADLEKKLDAVIGEVAEGALSGRQLFLLTISFVVCMVGIANAMLMAITERFREIATMKCLGATDGFILNQFLLEAAIQGITGGIIGTVVGFLLALMKSSFGYGSYLYAYFPSGAVVVNAGISLAAGVVLATLASIYPSWAASRMAPMEAMRVE